MNGAELAVLPGAVVERFADQTLGSSLDPHQCRLLLLVVTERKLPKPARACEPVRRVRLALSDR